MAGRFDLSKYQTVKQRKDMFATDHPNGVILAVPMKADGEEALFTVAAWENVEGYAAGLEALKTVLSSGSQITDLQALLVMGPNGLGTAYEAKWMAGASKTSWTENAEESAIGRCLDNIGYHGDGKCSREEVEKVQRAEGAIRESGKQAVQSEENPLADPITLPQDYPDVNALVLDHSGKRGINELRNVVVAAKLKGWDQGKLLAWIKSQGVDLADGELKNSDFVKLNFAMRSAA